MSTGDESLGSWLERLASDNPAPGGGAVAALCGALAAALVSMVARFTVGRPKYKDVEEHVQKILKNSERARKMLTELIEADARAFQLVSLAYKMPKTTDEERVKRDETLQQALTTASDVPVMVAEIAREVLVMAQLIAQIGNRTVLVDAGTAAFIGIATINAAELNVRENLRGLHDEVHAHALQKRLALVTDGIAEIAGETLSIIEARTQGPA
jgi:formiminotetrahydrofolate cyclodeaminase